MQKFFQVGFEGHECLTMEERQALEILRLLPECLILEELMQVSYSLQTSAPSFRPLAQDQKW